MSKSVIEHVLSRLQDIGIKDVFGVAGDFAFPLNDAVTANKNKTALLTKLGRLGSYVSGPEPWPTAVPVHRRTLS
jgi:TPP-dependent 2-oxoacid decarboxylase